MTKGNTGEIVNLQCLMDELQTIAEDDVDNRMKTLKEVEKKFKEQMQKEQDLMNEKKAKMDEKIKQMEKLIGEYTDNNMKKKEQEKETGRRSRGGKEKRKSYYTRFIKPYERNMQKAATFMVNMALAAADGPIPMQNVEENDSE